MNAGGISVPIFTTYAKKDYEYILKDRNPSLAIISNINQFEKIKSFLNLEKDKIISFEDLNQGSTTLDGLLKINLEETNIIKKLKRNSPACIIYTSGTSGNPKGVVLSHGGILSNCEGALDILKPLIKKKNPIFLTWLPLSHSYEHTVQFIQILVGATIIVTKPGKDPTNCEQVRT